MAYEELYKKLENFRVIPVLAVEHADAALPLADALIAGGLPVAEITFRTKAAADVIATLSKKRPELLIGAGTVLDVEHLMQAKDCGATFAVAPGFNPQIVAEALKLDLPFSPGIMTPSDIEGALSFGVTVLKFFPAEAAGGLNLLKSLAAPYAHTGIKFMPTGGINQHNFREYLALDSVLAVGGTWVARKNDIAAGNWEKITEICRKLWL